MKQWMGEYRVMYNMAIDKIRRCPRITRNTLRNELALEERKKEKNQIFIERPYLLHLRKSVRELAVFEARTRKDAHRFKSKKQALKKGETMDIDPTAVFIKMKKSTVTTFKRS
jgi:hypothetical protein